MSASEDVPDLNQVIGERVRRLRLDRGLSQDGMAEQVQRWGLLWDRPTVGRKEAGQRRFTAEELLILPLALNCRIVDLIAAETVRLPGTGVTYDVQPQAPLHVVASGARPFPRYPGLPPVMEPSSPSEPYVSELTARRQRQVERVWPEASSAAIAAAELSARNDTERYAARELGIDPFDLSLLSIRQWGRSFQAERNRRAAEELGNREIDAASLNAHRARVARTLLTELRDVIEEGWS